MRLVLLGILSYLLVSPLQAADKTDVGLVTLKSPYSVEQTLNRLEQVVTSKKLQIFARIDHEAGAKKVDMALSPTAVLLFGNPKIGTKLMQCNPQIGLDLPLKVLSWQDAQGQVWLGYTAPAALAERYQLGDCGAAVIKKVTGALQKFTTKAVSK